ncbi:hypothetical protein INT47_009540 [Mucor saturninus]|uniref:Uncharacterized protein n=1 Tax=Mucor saturninus TaxID=64648 RepID=A0A8H7R7V8_9FUNG|nr:hypothetical protein INT47_009540 [Mucor saturninus]
MNNDLKLFEVSAPLPTLPPNATKEITTDLIKNYALENDFELIKVRSSETRIHFNSKNNQGWRFSYTQPTGDERFHNHPLSAENVLLSSNGRNNKLNSDDVEKIHKGIEQEIPTKLIQKLISAESGVNKMTVHDINNLRYKIRIDMMLALEKNKEYYANILGQNVVELNITISRGLKDATESAIWFKSPGCAQVVADAYNIPVCVYNCPLDTSRLDNPLTFLPVSKPVRPKTKYPPVTHLYFNIDDSYKTLFKTTWNLFGQFAKFRSSDEPKGEPEMIQLLD